MTTESSLHHSAMPCLPPARATGLPWRNHEIHAVVQELHDAESLVAAALAVLAGIEGEVDMPRRIFELAHRRLRQSTGRLGRLAGQIESAESQWCRMASGIWPKLETTVGGDRRDDFDVRPV